ncbi:GIY-YIG nuclease family protein [Tautonia marina]|uniref:GIY-YIG nuclease family protein n=1 Tax=Tautonia marina TaxID=2653855 RepID=UPI0012606C80|nr:GIY-YIG nuclease family protein [Tautonia marina]
MTRPNAKTIQIFLPTGEPRGLRIAEMTNRIVQVVLIPRSDLARAKERPEFGQVAAYFLFGESEEAAKPQVYVGQSEDPRSRLDRHNVTKDFWRTAAVCVSRTQSFTPAHIRYLEWYSIQEARRIGRFEVVNEVTPGKPFVTEPIEADLLDAFDTLGILLSALGYPIFEPIFSPVAAPLFFCTAREADGKGELVEDGFVVRAGSTGRADIVPSASSTFVAAREKLRGAGILVEEDSRIRFTQDYLFSSPSTAAMVVMGRTANGWVEWKDTEGRTLHEVYRVEALG